MYFRAVHNLTKKAKNYFFGAKDSVLLRVPACYGPNIIYCPGLQIFRPYRAKKQHLKIWVYFGA
jgi:hypothetical protein